MAPFVSTLLFLLIVVGSITPAVSQSKDIAEPTCYDWGESNKGAVSVLDGEVGWISCPLFSHPSVYNYTSTQSAGHNLFWYRVPEGQDLEQPIPYSSRLSRDKDRLWLQPAATADTGQYICMLSNKSSCSKIAIRLKVLRPDDVVRSADCQPPVAVAPNQMDISFQTGKKLDCPDRQEASKMADNETTVTWYHKCTEFPLWNIMERQLSGVHLQIHVMLAHHQGLYFCKVSYSRAGKELHFTRSINISGVIPPHLGEKPSILKPGKDQILTVKQDTDVSLVCTAKFPYRNSSWDIWWTVDGKMPDKVADSHRFSKTNRLEEYDHGERTEESVLLIRDFQSEDLKREFNCSVRNNKGFETRRAQLALEAYLPLVELGCGLGVTLVLILLLFVVYHIFWLELLLLYRSWFGTDERHTDDKQYDVYISYARNSEEEQFVLSTLRSVLENELGYSVCIFDRDSLPGGNLSEAILHSMQRSRRLLLILSPNFLAEKSFSLLECRLALYLQHSLRASIVAIVYHSISKLPCVEAAQVRQAATTIVTWRGSRSEPRRSRFWLRLRLAMPVRPLAMGRRLIDSTSSHSDLAALALQRVQRIQSQKWTERANQSRRNRRTLPRGKGRVKSREGWSQHSTSCHGCAGVIGQMEDMGTGLRVETEMQQVTHDRTETRSDPVPQTESTPTPDPNHDPVSDLAPDSALPTCRETIEARTSE